LEITSLNRRVLITGASGFVGRHLVQALLRRKAKIAGTCFPEKPDECGFPSGVIVEHIDIRDKESLAYLVRDFAPHWVIHLAALSNVRLSWEKRRETIEVNLLGTFNLVEVLREEAPRVRLLFVSSSDVYGLLKPIDHPLREDEPLRIVNPYAFSKASSEMLVAFYQQIEGIDSLIVRAFPHTGPGQSPLFVCSDWAYQIAQIEKGEREALLKVGNIEIKRDFTDVRDVVQAYLALLEKGRQGEIYNVCSGQAISLRWILETLIAQARQKIRVEIDPGRLRKTDIPVLYGDNSKLRKVTGWQPSIPLTQTLKDLLDYWRRELGVPGEP
jgi:GDP-4-dehydro-6-deoxy-D-mannose reductase